MRGGLKMLDSRIQEAMDFLAKNEGVEHLGLIQNGGSYKVCKDNWLLMTGRKGAEQYLVEYFIILDAIEKDLESNLKKSWGELGENHLAQLYKKFDEYRDGNGY